MAIRKAIIKKAPGGKRKRRKGGYAEGITAFPHKVPLPRTSLIAPIKVIIAVNPIPIPKPSRKDRNMELREA